jgi:hypothetical protein
MSAAVTGSRTRSAAYSPTTATRRPNGGPHEIVDAMQSSSQPHDRAAIAAPPARPSPRRPGPPLDQTPHIDPARTATRQGTTPRRRPACVTARDETPRRPLSPPRPTLRPKTAPAVCRFVTASTRPRRRLDRPARRDDHQPRRPLRRSADPRQTPALPDATITTRPMWPPTPGPVPPRGELGAKTTKRTMEQSRPLQDLDIMTRSRPES